MGFKLCENDAPRSALTASSVDAVRSHDFHIQISKYRSSRYFAIYLNGDLLAVTVYKKGAVAIREALTRHGVPLAPQPTSAAEFPAPQLSHPSPPRPRADDF
jgi:hypothetical protein